MVNKIIKKKLIEEIEVLHNLIKELSDKKGEEKEFIREIRLLNIEVDNKINLLRDIERSNQPNSFNSFISLLNNVLEEIGTNDITNLVPKLKNAIQKFIDK